MSVHRRVRKTGLVGSREYRRHEEIVIVVAVPPDLSELEEAAGDCVYHEDVDGLVLNTQHCQSRAI